jgi:hypothetical protein
VLCFISDWVQFPSLMGFHWTWLPYEYCISGSREHRIRSSVRHCSTVQGNKASFSQNSNVSFVTDSRMLYVFFILSSFNTSRTVWSTSIRFPYRLCATWHVLQVLIFTFCEFITVVAKLITEPEIIFLCVLLNIYSFGKNFK